MRSELFAARQFMRHSGAFFRQTLTPQTCRALLVTQLQNRAQTFLSILDQGVFANPQSPYGALFKQANLTYGDVVGWVERYGIENALTKLYEVGVYITLDEFKGRKPITRLGLELHMRDRDFDNPLNTEHFTSSSGGSRRGTGRRMVVDLDLLRHEAAYEYYSFSLTKTVNHPKALWRPVPPGGAGIKAIFRYAALNQVPERWFSQTALNFKPSQIKYLALMVAVIVRGRLSGRALPWPRHVASTQALVVAQWLAEKCRQGQPAHLNTNVGSMVRICLAVIENHLDIRGSFFRVGGEPLTPTKAQLAANVGTRLACHYNMSEVGIIGLPCGQPTGVDEVHVAQDKVALVSVPMSVGGGAATVDALFGTTLLPSAPKLMLNVELGDYGVLEKRECDCLLGQLGFDTHLHTIRSYEKLTTDGMHFLGPELLRLVDEILPAQFGGTPGDYQFVEEEDQALSRVSLIVSPRIVSVDEEAIVDKTLQFLGSYPGGHHMMADYWRQGQTLRVVRREPYTTAIGKIHALHFLKKGERESS